MKTLIIISLIVALILFIAFKIVTYRPKVKEVPLTDEERAEIEEALRPYIETIKKRIDEAEGRTCSSCRYAECDIDEYPCKDCLGPGSKDRFEHNDDIAASYAKAVRARMKR